MLNVCIWYAVLGEIISVGVVWYSSSERLESSQLSNIQFNEALVFNLELSMEESWQSSLFCTNLDLVSEERLRPPTLRYCLKDFKLDQCKIVLSIVQLFHLEAIDLQSTRTEVTRRSCCKKNTWSAPLCSCLIPILCPAMRAFNRNHLHLILSTKNAHDQYQGCSANVGDSPNS